MREHRIRTFVAECKPSKVSTCAVLRDDLEEWNRCQVRFFGVDIALPPRPETLLVSSRALGHSGLAFPKPDLGRSLRAWLKSRVPSRLTLAANRSHDVEAPDVQGH